MSGAAGRKGEQSLTETIVRMVLGRSTTAHLVVGPGADAVRHVAARSSSVAVAHEAFTAAHWSLLSSGDDAARIVFRKEAGRLRRELGAVVRRQPDLAADAKSALTEVDELVGKVRSRSGGLASRAVRRSWWDRLFRLAENDEAVRSALDAFQDACAHGDKDGLVAAAAALSAVVRPKLAPSKAREFAERINGVVRRLNAVQVSADGSKVLVALLDHVDQLDPADPVRAAVLKLADAVRHNGERWMVVANTVAGMKRAQTPEEVRAMIWRLQGQIGEMLAFSTHAYQLYVKQALEAGQALARRLNSEGPGGWKIMPRRSHVRAPASPNSPRLAAFYDDAIILRRTDSNAVEGEAIVLIATQVKSGDWSSSRVVAQIEKDLERELSGRIEVDGLLCRLRIPPAEFRPKRVFVGTVLPEAGEVAGAGTEFGVVLLPMGGDEISSVAHALLDASGLVP